MPVARTKILLFMGTAFAAWLVGSINILRFTTVQANQGIGLEFQFIIAAVIGGCLLTGGFGSAIGAAIGALIFGMARQGIVFAELEQRLVHALPRHHAARRGAGEQHLPAASGKGPAMTSHRPR